MPFKDTEDRPDPEQVANLRDWSFLQLVCDPLPSCAISTSAARIDRCLMACQERVSEVWAMLCALRCCEMPLLMLQGWSPERSMRFGAAFLQPLGEALDALR
jgi:hypothetical protein